MGTRFTDNRGFRDQQLSANPRARARLNNARAALYEQQLERPTPTSIIGGQFLDQNSNQMGGINGAAAMRDAAQAESDAQRKMRAESGSPTIDIDPRTGMPRSQRTSGGTSTELGVRQQPQVAGVAGPAGPDGLITPQNPGVPLASAGGMNGDPLYEGGPSGAEAAGQQQPEGALPPLSEAGANPWVGPADQGFQGGPSGSTPGQRAGAFDGQSSSAYQSRGMRQWQRSRDFGGDDSGGGGDSSSLSDVFGGNGNNYQPDMSRRGMGAGYRDGGEVTKKMVNQPGMTKTSKIRMPVRDPGYKWGRWTPTNRSLSLSLSLKFSQNSSAAGTSGASKGCGGTNAVAR
jgi:hypothetical protein